MKHFIITIFLFTMILQVDANPAGSDFNNYSPRFEVFRLPGSTANNVQQIVQDSIGYLWFATQDGLVKYDGQNFHSYTHSEDDPNSIQTNYVESIFIDSKGIFWLTHWQAGSLTSFDPSREIFTTYLHDPNNPETILPGELSVVTEDKSGNIWIGGQTGLNRLDRNSGKVKRFQHDPGIQNSLSCNKVRALYVDSEGTLWVGTGFPWDDVQLSSEGGLNRYNAETETFSRYLHDHGDPGSIANNKVRALLEDSKGNFWVGTVGDGLHLMDRETGKFTRLSYDPKNPGKLTRPYLNGLNPETTPYSSHVTSVYEDRQNRIWISAVDGGLNIFDPATGLTKHFESGTAEDDLKTNFIWSVFQSRDNTLWLCTGTDGGAVYKVKDRDVQIPFFRMKEEQISNNAEFHGILKDNDGRIWITQYNPIKVYRIDRQKSITEEIPIRGFNFKDNPFIAGISLDMAGNIWISTWDGFYRCKANESEFQLFQPEEYLKDEHWTSPAAVKQTKNGNFWFGLWWDSGLARYNPDTDETVIFKNNPDDPASLTSDRILGLYEDEKGNVWIGGGSQAMDYTKPLFIDRYDPQTNSFEHFIESKNNRGIAFDITPDAKGNLWFIDFSSGLFKLNPQTKNLRKISSQISLFPNSQLYSLKKDKAGKFWLSTETNILEFDPETETLSIFDESHGVKPARNSFFSGNIAADGELLFARENGFHYFYPDIFSDKKNLKPDIRITGFKLIDEQSNGNNKGNLKSSGNNSFLKTNQIQVNYAENVFSFSVANFNYYNPETNKLEFMLEGFDQGWRSDLNNENTPYYINVPPGKYTFRARGTNSFGFLDKEGISMNVIILPPWWKSTWAYIVYALLFIAMVFGVDRFQRQRLLGKEKEKNREKELIHAREIEKAYTELKATQAQLIQSEKMASLGELTAGIAHEIQNPLNFVNNFSEVNRELLQELNEEIEKGNLDEVKLIAKDVIDNEDKINFHGKRADAIVKGMLQHSRSSSGVKEPTDINVIADEYLRLAYHGLRAKDKSFNATMKTDFDETIGKINVIPQDIGRVILNLITNAFYAVTEKKKAPLHPEGSFEKIQIEYQPTVTVSTSFIPPSGGQRGAVLISVSDNGNGIPPTALDKIFQPFFTTKPSGQGTGLGLSMSYEIITKAHGGELKVESKPGEGATFTIILPV